MHLGFYLQFHLLSYFLKQAISHQICLGDSNFSQKQVDLGKAMMSSVVLVIVMPRVTLRLSTKPLLQGTLCSSHTYLNIKIFTKCLKFTIFE